MTPQEKYHQQIVQEGFKANPEQAKVVIELQRIYQELIEEKSLLPEKGFLRWLKFARKSNCQPVQGLYLWGSVGTGKTWLMDLFYQCLPITNKMRLHFHRFMQFVHQELRNFQGQINPLQKIAKHLIQRTQVICLDEFLVNDVADALLLANLLEALFQEGITLLTTANTAPDNLYRYGTQREQFLPAIELLKKHMHVMQLQNHEDYRLQVLEKVGAYYYPLNERTKQIMQENFQHMARGHGIPEETLHIAGRAIPTIACFNDVVWFDFSVLCNVPRSQMDYLDIAKYFSKVFVSNVPKINKDQDNKARYLINMVDVFYDARVKLFLSAEVALDDLYPEGRLQFEFQRTRSRLKEMQSREYFLQEHWSSDILQQSINDDIAHEAKMDG